MATDVAVLADGLAFPEGPAFAPDGDLWCVELDSDTLVRVTDAGPERHRVGGEPNGLAFDAAGRAWICNDGLDAVQRFDPETGAVETVADAVDGEPLAGPNDLAFDPGGTLVFTCPRGGDDDRTGDVCRLRDDGTVETLEEDMRFPNGLVFADGGERLLVAETDAGRVTAGAWDRDGKRWRDPAPWADVSTDVDRDDTIGPDGMAVSAAGEVFVAIYGAGHVAAIGPDGSIETHELPGAEPTNVAFDPAGDLGLVVTEAERGELLSLPELGPGSPDSPYLG